jgi:hypothetical protein
MGEKQRIVKICGNRIIRKQALPILGPYVRDKQSIEAWFRPGKYLQRIQGLKGNYWLPVDERYAMPISPYQEQYYNKQEVLDLTDESVIADTSCNFTRMENDIQMHKSRYYDMLGLSIMGLVITLIIFAIIQLRGQIHLGG